MGKAGGSRHIIKAFTLRYFLICRNLANSFFGVKNVATVDAFGMIIVRLLEVYIVIQREASALLFLLQWAMREPLQVVRATSTGFHALF